MFDLEKSNGKKISRSILLISRPISIIVGSTFVEICRENTKIERIASSNRHPSEEIVEISLNGNREPRPGLVIYLSHLFRFERTSPKSVQP